jgi:hypothetical protein
MMFFFTVFEAEAQPSADMKTLQVMGRGMIHNDNIPAAKERAVSNSLMAALQREMIALLPPEILSRHFEAIPALLQSSVSKSVKHYRILAETRHQDTYQVLIETTLSIASLRKQLKQQGIWESETRAPKILLLTAEKKLNDLYSQYWWETVNPEEPFPTYEQIGKALNGAGFDVLDRMRSGQSNEQYQLQMMSQISVEEAVGVATQLGADMVLLTHTKVHRSTGVIDTEEAAILSATITARLLLTETGEEVMRFEKMAEAIQNPSDPDGLEALSAAADKVTEKLIEVIQTTWEKINTPVQQIEIEAGGSAYSIGNFIVLRRILNAMPETKRIQTRRIQSKTAFFVVDFRGDVYNLSEALMQVKSDQFILDVKDVTDNHLSLELVFHQFN